MDNIKLYVLLYYSRNRSSRYRIPLIHRATDRFLCRREILRNRKEIILTFKKAAQRITAAALFFAVAFSAMGGPIPAHAVTLQELQTKQSTLEQKSSQLDDQLKKLKNDTAKQQEYSDAINQKIINIEQQIDSKTLQIKQLDADILAKQKEISSKQKEIDENFKKLKDRVYALYLTGEASNLEIMLNAENLMDLADKTKLLQVISQHDTGLINSLKSDIQSVKAQKTAIETNRKTVTASRTALEKDQQQLTALADESAKVLASLGQTREKMEAEVVQNRKSMQAAKDSVDKWLSRYYTSQSGSTGSSTAGSSGSSVSTPSSGRYAKMLAEAQKYLGYPYRWGGSNPDTSFDCSGYVSWVVNNSGWNLGRLGAEAFYYNCTPVSGSAARPGDLVFFANTYTSGISHIGIYLGNGTMINCSNQGVSYANISSGYWKSHFYGFGRLP